MNSELEREAFEKTFPHLDFSRLKSAATGEDFGYENVLTHNVYLGWQARAALSTEAQGDLKEKLRKILLSSEPEFHEKVIHGLDDDWQTYSITLYMDIPFQYENESYPKNFKPSKSAAEAIDAWLDELFKG